MNEKNPIDDVSDAPLAADDATSAGPAPAHVVEDTHSQADEAADPKAPVKLRPRDRYLARKKRAHQEEKLASQERPRGQSPDLSNNPPKIDQPPSDSVPEEASPAPITAALVTDKPDMTPESESRFATDDENTVSIDESAAASSDLDDNSSDGTHQDPAHEALPSEGLPEDQSPNQEDAPAMTSRSSTAPTPDRLLTSGSAVIEDSAAPEHEECASALSAPDEQKSSAHREDAEATAIESSESLPTALSRSRALTFDDVRTAADLIAVLTEVKPTPKIQLPATSPVRAALSRDTAPLDDLHIEIDRLAETDAYLEIALSLISAAEKFGLTGRARTTLSNISALLLIRHPELSSLELEQVLASDSATVNLDTAPPRHSDIAEICRLIDQRISKLGIDSASGRKWKPTDAQKLRTNSILTAILLSADNEDWDALKYIQALATHVWSPPTKSTGRIPVKPKFDRTSLIVSKPAHGALATVLGELEGQITAQSTELAAAQDETTKAIARYETARHQIEALHAQLLSKDDEITELKFANTQINDELALEKSGRRSDRTKAINKIETLRETVSPIITRQISVLEDALDALRRDRPHVTDQFVDRSIAELQRTRAILHPDDSLAAEGGVK